MDFVPAVPLTSNSIPVKNRTLQTEVSKFIRGVSGNVDRESGTELVEYLSVQCTSGCNMCELAWRLQATIGIDFLSKTMYLEDRTVRLQLW